MTGFFLPWNRAEDRKRISGRFYFPKRHRAFRMLSARAVVCLEERKKENEPEKPDKKKRFCIAIDRKRA